MAAKPVLQSRLFVADERFAKAGRSVVMGKGRKNFSLLFESTKSCDTVEGFAGRRCRKTLKNEKKKVSALSCNRMKIRYIIQGFAKQD